MLPLSGEIKDPLHMRLKKISLYENALNPGVTYLFISKISLPNSLTHGCHACINIPVNVKVYSR